MSDGPEIMVDFLHRALMHTYTLAGAKPDPITVQQQLFGGYIEITKDILIVKNNGSEQRVKIDWNTSAFK